MKIFAIATVLATVSVCAYAVPDAGDGAQKPRQGFMESLTDSQRSCIQEYGCEMPPMPEPGTRPEKPADGQPPVRPDGESGDKKGDMDCMRQAMEACGVQMPTPHANAKKLQHDVRQNM